MLKIINISAVIAVVFIVLFSVVDFRHKAEYVEKPKGHMEGRPKRSRAQLKKS